jgi:hypothetical protein
VSDIISEVEAELSPAHHAAPGSRVERTQSAAAQEGNVFYGEAEPLPEKDFIVPVMERAAIFAGYTSFVFTGTETAVFRAMPRDDVRKCGYITCTGTGPVYVGTNKSALTQLRSNGLPSSGQIMGVAVLAAGVTLPVTHQEAMYVATDGTHSATVMIGFERWTNEPVT